MVARNKHHDHYYFNAVRKMLYRDISFKNEKVHTACTEATPRYCFWTLKLIYFFIYLTSLTDIWRFNKSPKNQERQRYKSILRCVGFTIYDYITERWDVIEDRLTAINGPMQTEYFKCNKSSRSVFSCYNGALWRCNYNLIVYYVKKI